MGISALLGFLWVGFYIGRAVQGAKDIKDDKDAEKKAGG